MKISFYKTCANATATSSISLNVGVVAFSVVEFLFSAHAQQLAPETKYAKVLAACKIAPGDVQAEPFLKDGEVAGFRYTNVRPGSAYARAGFKAGDVLVEQNGVKMRTPDDVISAFEAVSVGAPQVSKVERAGKQIVFKMKCPK